MKSATLGESNLLRIQQIIGDPDKGIQPLIPIGRTAWYAGIKRGIYPQPLRLGPRLVVWKAADIRNLIERLDQAAAA
jgi:predicted DNA-binding transcriptional regulator AlpA